MHEVPQRATLLAARIWQESKGVAAVSAALGRVLQDTTGVLPTVIPNPVDTGFFTLPDDAHSSESPRFVTVANLNANKCIDLLIAAFAIVLKSSANALLEIVGTGPEFRSLNALCEQLRVGHRVKFLGAVDREGVRAALWRASCFVSASRNETFGIAIGEALATGLSVISTMSGGPEELLGDHVGTLVARDDVDAMANAMLRVAPASEVERESNRRRVLELCSPDRIARAYVRLYGSAVNELGGISRR
jgi:glycosyltransferase involved in cell wall biosynthesis